MSTCRFLAQRCLSTAPPYGQAGRSRQSHIGNGFRMGRVFGGILVSVHDDLIIIP